MIPKAPLRTLRLLVLGAPLTIAAALCASGAPRTTALDEYVRRADSTYRYELVSTLPGAGYTAYVLDMTSQTWRKPDEVDRTAWRHWLTILRPSRTSTSTAMLFITGGSLRDKPPAKPDSGLLEIALYTNSVVAELRMVPNQPLSFAGGRPLSEDDLIAHAWDKYLRTGDAGWLPRLPMTKSAVRAMDTVTAFCARLEGGAAAVDRFVVAGASKRGWTTWTTAAVDRRVRAIAPIVIDLLNLEESFRHHWQAYGFWAPAIKEYADYGIMDWMGTSPFRKLLDLVDPYSYRERFTMPKFILNSAGDQFFLPDSSRFYFDGLPGEKCLRYVPNSDHSLRGSDAVASLAAWYDSLLRDVPRPRFSWKFEGGGAIRVLAQDQPKEVKLWQAVNSSRRDFRLESLGPAYKGSLLEQKAPGVYLASPSVPETGWTAYFVELTFDTGRKHPLKLTTPVRVAPERLPYPPPRPGKPQ